MVDNKKNRTSHIESQGAALTWQNDVPVSEMFDDPYFSLKDGEAEAQYVFLKHNNLPQAFFTKNIFSIGETGFGTGLNFFVTAQYWISAQGQRSEKLLSQEENSTSHLYYYSIEKYPIEKTELVETFKNWPQYAALSAEFITQYPENCPGFHRIYFPTDNITLVLMIGDVVAMLDQMLEPMDAWYLDGFSPSKNPEMWSQTVFEKIVRASKDKATFATFAAAGFVRRNLQAEGFTVKKASGFGKKREMLYGVIESIHKKKTPSPYLLPWYALNAESSGKSAMPVAIIGAGLAGLSCAFSLTKKKINSIVIEAGSTVGAGASGNPAGIVLPRITADLSAESQFYINSFRYAINQYDRLKGRFTDLFWEKNGVLQFESAPRLQKMASLLLPASLVRVVNAAQAEKIAGVEMASSALYFPQAGTISPTQLCEVLLKASASYVETRFETNVVSLQKNAGMWELINQDGGIICRAKNIVIANAFDVSRLLKTGIYTVEPNRGQLSFLPSSDRSSQLKANICGEGYVIPSSAQLQGRHVIGATYGGDIADVMHGDHLENWRNANMLMPDFLPVSDEIHDGRVSFRATTVDRLPVVGPVIDEDFYSTHYMDLHHGKPARNYPKAEYKAGLYLTVGHGSRGLVSCMATSNYIAELIAGAAITSSSDVVSLLHPSRFLIRQFKKSRC